MNEKDFKDKNKPAACTRPPWAKLIPEDDRNKVLAKIREESNLEYGRSLDECPKRLVCMGKQCIGRPLPWKSETARPYLEQLKSTHNIIDGELFLNSCDVCPIANSCSYLCPQVNDFLHRDKKKEATLVYKEKLDNIPEEAQGDTISLPMLIGYEVPWDAVSPRKQRVVRKYLYEHKDFLTIARQENLNNQSRAKYEYYSALTKMSEYAVMRKFIDKKGHELAATQLDLMKRVYFENKTLTEAGKELGITRQAAYDRLKRVKNRFKITWHRFVKKHDNKVIYNIPEVLR